MRLVCPNCGAQYEVPEDVIPPEGRDVQCSSCGSTWFQDAVETPVEPDEFETVTRPDEDWVPAVDASDTLAEEAAVETDVSDAPAVTVSSDATDEALAAAVKAAVARARPDHVVQQADVSEELPEAEDAPAEDAEHPQADAFESELEAHLDADVEDHAEDAADQDIQDVETFEDSHQAVPEDDFDDQLDGLEVEPRPSELPRRSLDPSVAGVLQEEAALEASLRKEEVLESQPDLGLDEPDQNDEAATRARQARERMARMRGVPVDAPQQEPEVVPANSRRDLLPDIEEINSTLRATEDRSPSEQPDGRPTIGQRRSGGRRMGFALALLVIAAGVYVYTSAPQVNEAFPKGEPYVSGFVNFVDNGRLALDAQMTKLMLWLDGIASKAGQG